jgi:hypothetical protein
MPMPTAATAPAAPPKHPAEEDAREIADSVREALAGGIVLTATLRDGGVDVRFYFGPRAQIAEQMSPDLNVTTEWLRTVLAAQRGDALPLFVRLDQDDIVFPFDVRDPLRLTPAPAKAPTQTQQKTRTR